ncbi:hypothetical protein ACEWY4_024744 [Coilia grayii]|uniref:G-protein coupled receptors family 1 profile domain-containing protein n=1 Tax=Coilia grayii TaxID=363190 RepID=A0ABD1IXL7_9TELE
MHPEVQILLVFLVIGFCGGSAGLFWAVRCLFLHRRAGGRISIFIISLLLSDVFELVLIPFALAVILEYEHFGNEHFDGESILCAFIGAGLCGICFHQLVALEGILALTAHHWLSRLSTRLCSIISFFLWVGILVVSFLPEIGWVIGLILYVLTGVVAVISCVIVCKTTNSSEPLSLTERFKKPTVKVLAVALTTLLILYGPVSLFTGSMLIRRFLDFALWPFSIVRLRLIADPLLCVLVYKGVPPTQPNFSDQSSG